MKETKRLELNVMAIIGDTAHSKSVLRVLNSRFTKVAYITMGVQKKRTVGEYYENGVKVWEQTLSYTFLAKKAIYWLIFPISVAIMWFTPVLLAIRLAKRSKVKFNIFIGEFYIGVICGLILKKMGMVKKIIYWDSDWFPYQPRKKVKLLTYISNSIIFPYLDRFSAERADLIWNFNKRIIEARHLRWKGNKLKIAEEESMPPPLTLRRKKVVLPNRNEQKKIGFLGVLRPGQGVELGIEAIANLKKQNVNVFLEIVGTSSYEQYLKDYAEKLGVSDRVTFNGFVKEEKKVEEILQECVCALALFQGGKENYTYYTWPSKVGFYLECGLPVLITKSTAVADDVEEQKMGIVVESNLESVSRAIKTLVSNPKLYEEYSQNAIKYVQERAIGRNLLDSIERIV